MEPFTFHESAPAETASFDFEPSLFHNPTYLVLQRSTGWKWYYILHTKRKSIVGSCYFNIDGTVASSTVRSPFGSVESVADLPAEILYLFLVYIEKRLRAAGILNIIIKTPPFHYAPAGSALLQTFLFNLGYTVTNAQLGMIRATGEEFSTGLNRLERRKLKACETAKLNVKFHTNDDLEKIYNFIETCRREKGYPLSMTLPDLALTLERFPDRYLLLGLYLNDERVGAAIGVMVTRNILYNFYADHAKKYDSLSPMVMVVQGLYTYCQQHGVSLLDYGTSAIEGQPNFGLLNFKLRLGGVPSPKLTFEKNINL